MKNNTQKITDQGSSSKPRKTSSRLAAEPDRAIARKCKCGLTWCATCGLKKGIKVFYDHVKGWDWRYVRQVVLTVDPKAYPGGQDAFNAAAKGRWIANMVRNLMRTKSLGVVDWDWIIEWHRNGFPHWHLFLLMDKPGKAGMIGHSNLSHYWDAGYCFESPIKNEDHWKRLTGYFAKKGYFDKKKAHQARLPQWARETSRRIRRTGSKVKAKDNGAIVAREKFLFDEERRRREGGTCARDKIRALVLGQWFLEQNSLSLPVSNGEKLEKCGSQTEFSLYGIVAPSLGRFNIPYASVRRLEGEYLPKVGYVVGVQQLQALINQARLAST